MQTRSYQTEKILKPVLHSLADILRPLTSHRRGPLNLPGLHMHPSPSRAATGPAQRPYTHPSCRYVWYDAPKSHALPQLRAARASYGALRRITDTVLRTDQARGWADRSHADCRDSNHARPACSTPETRRRFWSHAQRPPIPGLCLPPIRHSCFGPPYTKTSLACAMWRRRVIALHMQTNV